MNLLSWTQNLERMPRIASICLISDGRTDLFARSRSEGDESMERSSDRIGPTSFMNASSAAATQGH